MVERSMGVEKSKDRLLSLQAHLSALCFCDLPKLTLVVRCFLVT